MVLNSVWFCPPGASGNVYYNFWLLQLGEGALYWHLLGKSRKFMQSQSALHSGFIKESDPSWIKLSETASQPSFCTNTENIRNQPIKKVNREVWGLDWGAKILKGRNLIKAAGQPQLSSILSRIWMISTSLEQSDKG